MTTTIKLINILLTSYSYLCMCVRMCVCEYVCGENTCDLTTRYISATQPFLFYYLVEGSIQLHE